VPGWRPPPRSTEELGGVPVAGLTGAGCAGTVADPGVGIQTKDGELLVRRGTGNGGEREAGDAEAGAGHEPLAGELVLDHRIGLGPGSRTGSAALLPPSPYGIPDRGHSRSPY
jgi:hypothetical protein